MCGIAGIFAPARREGRDRLAADAARMGSAIRHRGPDAGVEWIDAEAGIAFAHRRLSILDLSEAGAQPMTSACGRWVICYNGEVYNAGEILDEIRPRLESDGVALRGHSDTEIILEAMARLGWRATVERMVGMFAFALWDRAEHRLVLVRDRLGKKPLYWSHQGGVLLFGSELKALRAHPDCPTDIDRNAVAAFMRTSYAPDPLSIYRGVGKLPPGSALVIGSDGAEPRIERYWSLYEQAVRGAADPFEGDDAAAVDALDAELTRAVGQRMVADVPVGAFLSGGIDSSTVVALMQAIGDRPARSFSIGFHEAGYNEATFAKEVAAALGTDHTELYVTPEEAQAVIPKLPDIFDEPFADSSQIPTFLVSEMTRREVTVALSGDGGDEMFFGYSRYLTAQRFAKTIGYAPRPLRRLAAAGLATPSPRAWDAVFSVAPGRRFNQAGDKLHKLARALDAGPDAFYDRLVSHWTADDDVVVDGLEPSRTEVEEIRAGAFDLADRMRLIDGVSYLPDDIMVKVDRASMAVSLEARAPLLDHRVVEFAWRLPQRLLYRDGQGKWILRKLLARYIDPALFERPKMGFGVPIDAWLRGPLKDWADDLLSEEMFRKHGLLKRGPILKKWTEHLSGSSNWQYYIWDALMLHAWAERHR